MLISLHQRIKSGTITQYRARLGLTQPQAAEQAGVSVNAFNAAENLHFDKISWGALHKIAEWCGCLPEDLCPPEMRGQDLALSRVMYREVTVPELEYARECNNRLSLPAPNETVAESESIEFQKEWINETLNTLTYRQREVLKLRFGLIDDNKYTLEEIGKMFKCNRESIRQVELAALKRLRLSITHDPDRSPNPERTRLLMRILKERKL